MDNLLHYDPYMLFADFAALHRMPGKGVGGLSRPGALDAHGDPQHGAQRQVLIGSHAFANTARDIWHVRARADHAAPTGACARAEYA